MSYTKILVTGSTGVLGTAVRAISRDYPEMEFVFITSKECDITDALATLQTVRKHCPDAIFHLAAVSGGIGLSMKHQATMLRDNTLMALSILEAARRCNVKKTIMTLTTGMYPVNAALPLNEDNIHDGYPHDSNFGSSFAKRLIDPAIRAYREEFEINVVGLVPSGIFGENDNFNYDDAPMLPSLIRRFYESRNNNSDIVIWGDGKPLREYTYSRDLAKIYMWALENYNDAQVINIGTTEENSVADIAYMIADIMGISRRRIVFDATKPKGIFRKNTDNSRFMAISNFKYTPFLEGLEKTIRWFSDAYENRPETVRMYSKVKPK
ncbi:MAG: NAD-dependent epimerase/dehydratase family protein [Thermodesulfobacteriota bacterium]